MNERDRKVVWTSLMMVREGGRERRKDGDGMVEEPDLRSTETRVTVQYSTALIPTVRWFVRSSGAGVGQGAGVK